MKHTKEPWIIEDSGYDGIGKISAVGGYIADVDGNTIEQIMANTKRIVACVNACAGITDEALEAGVVHSSLINFEESLDLEKGEKFCFYNIPILEEA